MKQQVYFECTVCYKELTDEDKKENEIREIYYYTICSSCLNKASDRVLKILLDS